VAYPIPRGDDAPVISTTWRCMLVPVRRYAVPNNVIGVSSPLFGRPNLCQPVEDVTQYGLRLGLRVGLVAGRDVQSEPVQV
jgi:hypothetical protein